MKRLILLPLLLMGTIAWAAAPAKVLLIPFDSVGPAEKQWVAKALQQNLLAELSRVNSVQVVTQERAVSEMEAALKAASAVSADYVVFGSYQAVDGDLRLTGQVLDVGKKQAIAGLKSTGAQRDLFGMEDVISNQVRRALPQPVVEAKPEMLQQPPAAPPAIEESGPVVMDANRRAQELRDEVDRAIDRLRYSDSYADDYYYPPTYYSSYYVPYYPIYYFPLSHGFRHHHHYYPGGSISGSYHGQHFSGNFRVGGGSFSHGGGVRPAPVGNYVRSGPNFISAPR
jgi:TolB-like protein